MLIFIGRDIHSITIKMCKLLCIDNKSNDIVVFALLVYINMLFVSLVIPLLACAAILAECAAILRHTSKCLESLEIPCVQNTVTKSIYPGCVVHAV